MIRMKLDAPGIDMHSLDSFAAATTNCHQTQYLHARLSLSHTVIFLHNEHCCNTTTLQSHHVASKTPRRYADVRKPEPMTYIASTWLLFIHTRS
jgi:hypothetical protein